MMHPAVVITTQLWQHRRVLGAVVIFLAGLLGGLVLLVGGVLVATPIMSDEKRQLYIDVAAAQPVEVSWQEMVAVDAVRYHQDWENVMPLMVTKTALEFYWCHKVQQPDGKTKTECGRFTMDEVTRRLHFSPQEQEQARRMLASLKAIENPNWTPCIKEAPTFSPFGYVWPLIGPIVECYGMRKSPTPPYQDEMHWGVDVSAIEGLPVKAATSGTVSTASWAGNYGNLLVIRSDDGSMVTYYGHLYEFAVEFGDHVAAGQIIGYVGQTGRATGPHLHFETRPYGGGPVDPFTYWP